MSSGRAEMYQGLSAMLEAGVPILRSLRTLGERRRGSLGRALRALAAGVEAGNRPAETMKRHPKVFGPLDVLVVDVADTAGTLPEALKMLAEWYELRDRIRRTVLSGLALPLVILHIAALVVPLPRMIMGETTLFQYGLSALSLVSLFYIPAAVIVAVAKLTPKSGVARRVLDRVTLCIPVLGGAVRELALARFFGAFHMLYRTGGVPMTECVERSAEVAENAVVRSWVIGGARTAREGHNVSEGFSRRLPVTYAEAWTVGEESGKLDETLARLSNRAADNAQHSFTQFGIWLPRVIYFLVMILLVYHIFKMFSARVQMINELTR